MIVGIDHYSHASMKLRSAVADARSMARMLVNHADGTANYDCVLWADRTEHDQLITRAALRGALQQLFANFRGDLVFYFSGHGVITATGGWLVTYDGIRNDWGVSMSEVSELALQSQANDILILLDCCHGGDLGNSVLLNGGGGGRETALMREDMTVIAASLPQESAIEAPDHGMFTAAVLNALEGGSADPMGWVTAPSIYTYVERRFGGWPQQPVYKSHATKVTVVRQCPPQIDRVKLGRLTELFPKRDSLYRMHPDYEPEDEHGKVHKPVHRDKVEIAQLFKLYRDAGLLKPTIAGEQLYWTARRSHTVELTLRGQEYWVLVKDNKV
ncbi:MAG TPA: caspase family protein [Thermoanaerobaculia bacterium]|nr:caspase family protein [Thermoanaerobaculia bacterium]